MCTDCQKPCVLYAAKKLSAKELSDLDRVLGLFEYSCGTSLQDLATPDNSTPLINSLVSKVYARHNLACASPVETPYFTSHSFVDICYFCGSDDNLKRADDVYPVCSNCDTKEKFKPVKRKQSSTVQARAKKAKK